MTTDEPPRLTVEALIAARDAMLAKPIRQLVVVHPDDVNLADVKAMAAEHDASVVGNPYCPRGQAFVLRDDLEPGA